MKRVAIALACGFAGYLVGAFGGGWLVTTLTSNAHDGSVEGAMTGAFGIGPVVGLVALIAAFFLVKPRR